MENEVVSYLRCSLPKCSNPLTGQQRKFCSKKCQVKSYCSQNKNASAVTILPCKYFGEIDSVFPVTGTSPFFLSTRIQESNQTLVCQNPSDGKGCKQTYAFDCKPDGTPCQDKGKAEQGRLSRFPNPSF